jgi:hypothetical protein
MSLLRLFFSHYKPALNTACTFRPLLHLVYPIRSQGNTISALACGELQIHLSSPVLVIE